MERNGTAPKGKYRVHCFVDYDIACAAIDALFGAAITLVSTGVWCRSGLCQQLELERNRPNNR